MKLPKSLTTVTPLSKTTALIMVILLPFMGFYLGMEFQKTLGSENLNLKEKIRACIKSDARAPASKTVPDYTSTKIIGNSTDECKIFATLNNGETISVASTNLSGIEDSPCLENPNVKISSSGKYLAFEDVTGGIDSTVKIYSLELNKVTILYVLGTSTIFDFTFLDNDELAVLSGYPGIYDEQWLRVTNIKKLYGDYENNILDWPEPYYPDYFSIDLNDPSITKNLELTNYGVDYSSLKIQAESLIAQTEEPVNYSVFHHEEYSF